MTETNQNVTILLDRLYNLTSDDNIIIKETEGRINDAEKRVEEISSSIEVSKIGQEEEENRLTLFLQQKNKFETTFDGLTDESFSALRDIDINLEIGSLLSAIQNKSPEFIEQIMNAIGSHKASIETAEEEKNRILAELVVLKEELIAHNERKNQLASLLEQSLSPNEIERESLTANFVKRVLGLFDVFTTEEITKLTKLIMFPDEGLFEYDKNYAERVAKGLVGLVEAEEIIEEVITEEDDTKQTVVNEEAEEITTSKTDVESDSFEGPEVTLNFQKIEENDLERLANDSAEIDAPVTVSEEELITHDIEEVNVGLEESEEEITVPSDKETNLGENKEIIDSNVNEGATSLTEATSDSENIVVTAPVVDAQIDHSAIEELLTRLGLDIEKFKSSNTQSLEDIYLAISKVDEEVIERNYEILRSINLGDEAYKMRFNHMYITDIDFNKKITLLRAKNISEQKIQTLITDSNSGLRVTFEEIERRIQSVENLHGKIEDENVYLISKDISRYEENLDKLLRYGIDIDDKEARNHMMLLFESLYIPSNVEILKNYIISILKSNGKYALSVFWKKPEELVNDIDDLVEAGLESIIATHPEVLGVSADSILRRVKYCEESGKDVFADDMKSELCDYITKSSKFTEEFGYATLPELVDRKHTNDILVDVIGNSDYIEILLNILNDHYEKTDSFVTPEVEESMKDRYDEFCRYLEENAHAELTGKYTYNVDGVSICKNKLERNLAIILNTLASVKQPTLGVEREIVLVSALYNSRLREEELRKVAGSCLGFNSSAQEVITL